MHFFIFFSTAYTSFSRSLFFQSFSLQFCIFCTVFALCIIFAIFTTMPTAAYVAQIIIAVITCFVVAATSKSHTAPRSAALSVCKFLHLYYLAFPLNLNTPAASCSAKGQFSLIRPQNSIRFYLKVLLFPLLHFHPQKLLQIS